MSHYVLELLLWVLVVFFAGCVIGYLLRAVRGGRTAAVAPAPAVVETRSEALPEPEPVQIAAEPESGHMTRPRGLPGPRGGKPDQLQSINGIGPKNEKLLHHQGVFHFDQIAAWTPDQVAWLDDHLKFRGRISRDQWVRQAGLRAEGREKEFMKGSGSAKRG